MQRIFNNCIKVWEYETREEAAAKMREINDRGEYVSFKEAGKTKHFIIIRKEVPKA